MFGLRSALSFAFVCSPALAAAQNLATPDTPPFHRGQWGMQFGGGFSIASLGVLRFTSSTRAWLIDAGTPRLI